MVPPQGILQNARIHRAAYRLQFPLRVPRKTGRAVVFHSFPFLLYSAPFKAVVTLKSRTFIGIAATIGNACITIKLADLQDTLRVLSEVLDDPELKSLTVECPTLDYRRERLVSYALFSKGVMRDL